MNKKDLAERYLKNINKNVHLNFTLSYRPLPMERIVQQQGPFFV